MYFDWIEHTTGLLDKTKFCIVYSKTFFLIDSFISSRRLWTSHVLSVSSVLTLECVRIFDPYLVFLFYCLPDDVLCKIAI